MSRTRPAPPTVAFIDQYCAQYRSLFHNVRHFEHFTALHLGLLAETRRKSLPRLGQAVHADPQALQHFLANADWSVEALRSKRLDLLRQALGTTPCILCIDETGDRKKGHTTDYVATQSIGNLHTLANGIVSVNASGVLGTTTFPLLCRIFKPESRLKGYSPKPARSPRANRRWPSKSSRRCWPGASASASWWPIASTARAARSSARCTACACSTSSPPSAAPTMGSGCCLASASGASGAPGGGPSTASSATARARERFIRETIFGTRQPVRYYQVTTDPETLPPETLPPETTWDLMTNQPGNIERTVGNTFGLRTWIEDGFTHAKDDLGWADYRVTEYPTSERWWELVMRAYTLVSLQSADFAALSHLTPPPAATTSTTSVQPATAHPPPAARLAAHPAWDTASGWKHQLNNLRLLLQPYVQPYVCSCLLLPAPPLAPLGATPACPSRSDRARRARLSGGHLPLGSPNMTDEG